MNKEQVLQLVDEIMHEFASAYRKEARQKVEEKFTSTNKESAPLCDDCDTNPVVVELCESCYLNRLQRGA